MLLIDNFRKQPISWLLVNRHDSLSLPHAYFREKIAWLAAASRVSFVVGSLKANILMLLSWEEVSASHRATTSLYPASPTIVSVALSTTPVAQLFFNLKK